MKKYKNLLSVVIIMLFAAVTLPCQAAGNFYKGKTLTIVVTTAPGGGHDWWARVLAPYMKKYLGAKQVKVVNIPGGGNVRGDNYIYNAKPDGLTIGVIDTGAVFTQMFPAEAVHFDVKKYTELGSTDFGPFGFGTQPNGPYQTFLSMRHAKKPVVVLATGKGGSSYQITNIVLNGFKIPHRMVTGFKGEHQLISTFLTGDGDLFGGGSYHFEALKGKVNPVIMISDKRFPGLPHVPSLAEEVKAAHLSGDRSKALMSLAKLMFTDVLVVGPPGISQKRVHELEAALKKSVNNPSLKEHARKAHHIASYTPGSVIQGLVDGLVKEGPEFKRLNK